MIPDFSPELLVFLSALAASYRQWKGRPLLLGQAVLSPLELAVGLWEMSWDAFTRLPSRQSAADETTTQADRNRLLAAALAKGWVDNYEGTRISATGKKFEIKNTTLWNVVDATGRRLGQAAVVRG